MINGGDADGGTAADDGRGEVRAVIDDSGAVGRTHCSDRCFEGPSRDRT